MSSTHSVSLILFTPAQRERLAALADELIPAGEGASSASQAGIAGALLDRVIALTPERAVLLRQVVIEAADRSPADALAGLKAAQAADYDAFCETIAGAYFMSNQVRAEIAYPGRDPVPARADIADIEALLMPVFEGGFAPREV